MSKSDPDMATVEKAQQQLREFFDSVQIFVTRREPEGTVNIHVGGGNWYANYGFVKTWILQQETLIAQRAMINADAVVDEEED